MRVCKTPSCVTRYSVDAWHELKGIPFREDVSLLADSACHGRRRRRRPAAAAAAAQPPLVHLASRVASHRPALWLHTSSSLQSYQEADWVRHLTWKRYIPEPRVRCGGMRGHARFPASLLC